MKDVITMKFHRMLAAAALLLLGLSAHANPLAVVEPFRPGEITPMTGENLNIEVFETYSAMNGTFRFAARSGDSPVHYAIRLPVMIRTDEKPARPVYEQRKVSIRCGEEKFVENYDESDEKLTQWLRKQVGSAGIDVVQLEYSGYCPSGADIVIRYEQEHFDLGSDKAMVYLPLLPGAKGGGGMFRITVINKTGRGFEVRRPKKFASPKLEDRVTITPRDKDVIVGVIGG